MDCTSFLLSISNKSIKSSLDNIKYGSMVLEDQLQHPRCFPICT